MLELVNVRILFDNIIGAVPSMKSRLKADVDIVRCPAFETAVVNVQSLDEVPHTRAEKEE